MEVGIFPFLAGIGVFPYAFLLVGFFLWTVFFRIFAFATEGEERVGVSYARTLKRIAGGMSEIGLGCVNGIGREGLRKLGFVL